MKDCEELSYEGYVILIQKLIKRHWVYNISAEHLALAVKYLAGDQMGELQDSIEARQHARSFRLIEHVGRRGRPRYMNGLIFPQIA